MGGGEKVPLSFPQQPHTERPSGIERSLASRASVVDTVLLLTVPSFKLQAHSTETHRNFQKPYDTCACDVHVTVPFVVSPVIPHNSYLDISFCDLKCGLWER